MKFLFKTSTVSLALTAMTVFAAFAQDGFFEKNQAERLRVEQEFLKSVDFSRFKVHHQELTKNPHIAGTAENEYAGAGTPSDSLAAGYSGRIDWMGENCLQP